jgi:hypothetical protein
MLRLEQICNNLLIKYKAYLGDCSKVLLFAINHVKHHPSNLNASTQI